MSRAYGWTDSEIGDLTLARFRQAVAAANLAEFVESRREQSRFSWLGRTLALAVTGGYMTDGKANPAFDAAKMIAIDEIEFAQLEEAYAREATTPKPFKEPAIGSYERFTGMLGGLQREPEE